ITLPQLHADMSMVELERCADHPLARGVGFYGVTRRSNIEDEGREDVLRLAARHRLVAQLHPVVEAFQPEFAQYNLSASLDLVFSTPTYIFGHPRSSSGAGSVGNPPRWDDPVSRPEDR